MNRQATHNIMQTFKFSSLTMDWSMEMSNQSQARVALQAANHINGSAQCPELHVSQEQSIFYRRQKIICGVPQSQISSLRPSPPVRQENLIYHTHTVHLVSSLLCTFTRK